MGSETEMSLGQPFCKPHPDIVVHTVDAEQDTLIIVLEGQIRYQSAASLQSFLFNEFGTHVPKKLVLDFKRIYFVDSQGLAFLVGLYKFCRPKGCELIIRNSPAHVFELMKLTRLDAFIKME